MNYRTADECESHYKQCYLVRPQSPLPGTDMHWNHKNKFKNRSYIHMWQVLTDSLFICNSVKCPCNVTHDSVTLIFTFLIIIIIICGSGCCLLLLHIVHICFLMLIYFNRIQRNLTLAYTVAAHSFYVTDMPCAELNQFPCPLPFKGMFAFQHILSDETKTVCAETETETVVIKTEIETKTIMLKTKTNTVKILP